MPKYIDYAELKIACNGRWSGIFKHFNVDVGEGKHQPCPNCGGEDRFRFDGAPNNGSYICGQCGAGDGFSLLMKVFGWDFKECAREVAKVVGIVPVEKFKKKDEVDPAVALRHLYSTSQKLHPSDIVSKYLRKRGLVLTPNDIMYCPNCYESSTKKRLPAMIGIVRNKNGDGITMHRTYLSGDNKADVESPKKFMPAKEYLGGSSVRLFDPEDKMFEPNIIGVAEGIETAMSAAQMFQVAVWACLSTSILESFEPPEGINEVWIFSDNDPNFAGQRSAYILASKLYQKDYLVKVLMPQLKDWNDDLLEMKESR